jgi:hypothetical protein
VGSTGGRLRSNGTLIARNISTIRRFTASTCACSGGSRSDRA